MNTSDLEGLMAKVADLGRMSEEDARRTVKEVYEDGVVSRAEAEALFELNDKLTGADPLWDDRFCEAIRDFLLTVEKPVGWITDEECDWLMACVTRDGRISLETELDLLLDVLGYADGAPDRLGLFTLKAICDFATGQKRIDVETVDRLRRALFAMAGDKGVWVSRKEAAYLFELNDKLGRARNDPAWNDLFARAIGNHLMASAHPAPDTEAEALRRETWLEAGGNGVAGVFKAAMGSLTNGIWFDKVALDPQEGMRARSAAKAAAERASADIDPGDENWLMKRLGWDNTISPAERALIDFLKKEAPGFAVGIAATAA